MQDTSLLYRPPSLQLSAYTEIVNDPGAQAPLDLSALTNNPCGLA